MSAKRPMIDLMSLTSEQAVVMPEAVQRAAPKPKKEKVVKASEPATRKVVRLVPGRQKVKTENLEALAFKVPPDFRKRFRQRAVEADLKLNELLFEALSAWEAGQGLS